MNKFSNNLAVRALNHWRNYSIPTYLGLRILLLQVPKSESSNFLTEYLLNKLPLRKSGRYRHFLRFKGVSPSGETESRHMYAASPSTALAEAYALSLLFQSGALQNKSGVYSNLRPTSKTAGRSFTYFYSGYSERNARISKLLKQNTNFFVVANDIKNFYPTIDQQVVLKILNKHLDSIKDAKQHNFVENACNQLLSCTEGVPIGPALSHVLANLVLEPVDSEMYSLLKERYFRYVDDIFMVLEEDEVSTMQKKLESILNEQGFKLNPDKKDIISSSDWSDNVYNPEEKCASQQFHQLSNKILLYLWNEPSKKNALADSFKEEGIAMPIQRFATNATYGRYQRYMKYLVNMDTTNIYRMLIANLKHENTHTIMSDVTYLYDRFYEIASRIQIQPDNSHQIIRKLQVQRLRYLLNRLIYLTPYIAYRKLLDITPDMVEFYEYRSLINSLIMKSVSELIKVPGPAISTFASVFQELALGEVELETAQIDSPATLDSLATLTAFGIFEPPRDWIERLDTPNKEYIKFCMFTPLSSRVLTDFSYEDELRTLQINVDAALRQLLMTTRFSDHEGINFDALLVGAYGY